MKILVTGANGFVGSKLVEKFLKEGHSVRCLVHKNVHWLDKLPQELSSKIEIVQGSIT
ncbi:MAG: NAD-dependent epimerase/dehydratase family protein, partial [Elusimicrobiota bacterium]